MVLHYPVTRGTLAKEVYRVRSDTFTAWLREIGINHNRTLSPKELQKIIDTYGLREGVKIII